MGLGLGLTARDEGHLLSGQEEQREDHRGDRLSSLDSVHQGGVHGAKGAVGQAKAERVHEHEPVEAPILELGRERLVLPGGGGAGASERWTAGLQQQPKSPTSRPLLSSPPPTQPVTASRGGETN